MLNGTVRLRATGPWLADLEIDTESELPSGARAVTIDLGGRALVGTVVRQGVYASTLSALVVAGGNGFVKDLPAKSYLDVPASLPAKDLLGAIGESLSSTADATALAIQLPYWNRAATRADVSWSRLIRKIGSTWRVLPDGTVWVGTNDYPDASFEGDTLHEFNSEGFSLLSPDSGALLPATTFEGKRLGAVVYRLGAEAARAEAWAE